MSNRKSKKKGIRKSKHQFKQITVVTAVVVMPVGGNKGPALHSGMEIPKKFPVGENWETGEVVTYEQAKAAAESYIAKVDKEAKKKFHANYDAASRLCLMDKQYRTGQKIVHSRARVVAE